MKNDQIRSDRCESDWMSTNLDPAGSSINCLHHKWKILFISYFAWRLSERDCPSIPENSAANGACLQSIMSSFSDECASSVQGNLCQDRRFCLLTLTLMLTEFGLTIPWLSFRDLDWEDNHPSRACLWGICRLILAVIGGFNEFTGWMTERCWWFLDSFIIIHQNQFFSQLCDQSYVKWRASNAEIFRENNYEK
jgi:hypothetical protein